MRIDFTISFAIFVQTQNHTEVKNKLFTADLANYNRFETIEIPMRHFDLGGKNFIRLQSMTNTDTRDVEATVKQAMEIIEQGADYIRITTPTTKDLEALDEIRHKLRIIYETPIIADIHFSAKVALKALDIVEKIRINPGNLVDKPKGKEYTDEDYKAELKKIEEVFKNILVKAKEKGRVIRIGTNIGSLSERILQKYGATPRGMVVATVEYLEIARKYNFDNIVVSLKASNPKVNIWANRLLISEFQERGWKYPIHLGVTEAGNGLEGRIKSALGIGALLIDGIGDTVRVSLAEDPKNEIPVARKIVKYATQRAEAQKLEPLTSLFFNPYDFEPRKISSKFDFSVPRIIINSFDQYAEFDENFKPDYIIAENPDLINTYKEKGIKILNLDGTSGAQKICDVKEFLSTKQEECFVFITLDDLDNKSLIRKLKRNNSTVLIFTPVTNNIAGEARWFFKKLQDKNIDLPVLLKLSYDDSDTEDFAIKAAIDSSVLLIDGLVNGLFLESQNLPLDKISETGFQILQAAGSRYTRVEVIACPSCGRATFDVEQITNQIKDKFSDLAGTKIAVMGCIVNGLGEMADADYAYVGTSKGSVSLYKNKTLVEKNIPQEQALEKLEEIIERNK